MHPVGSPVNFKNYRSDLLCFWMTRRRVSSALSWKFYRSPRVTATWTGTQPVLVFTDGTCEQNGTQVTHERSLQSSMRSFCTLVMQCLQAGLRNGWLLAKTQVTCQAEIFPVLVAKLSWRKEIRSCCGLLTTIRHNLLHSVFFTGPGLRVARY